MTLRNDAPFMDLGARSGDLGRRARYRLAGHDDGDRQIAEILTAVLTDELAAVEASCAEAITLTRRVQRRRSCSTC